MSLGLFIHLERDDEEGLPYESGGQGGWAVTGVLTQNHAANAPAAGTSPPDDEGETLSLTPDPSTVAADLADPYLCPNRAYTFADPYAPTAVWQSVKRNGVEVTDFTAESTITVQGTDPSSDLVSLAVASHLGSEIRTLLSVTTAAAPRLTRSATFRPSNTGLTEGNWRL